MKLILAKNQLNMGPDQFLRRAGYAYHRDRRTGKESYARRLGSGFFPKLHMYVMEKEEQIIFDLHLDQKQASYAGSRMHSGEHDGEVVEGEISRLRDLSGNNVKQEVDNDKTVEEKIGNGDYKNEKIREKKSWWKFW